MKQPPSSDVPPAPASPVDDSLTLLRAGASRLGLRLDEAQLAAFRLYRRELLDWNQRFNLTAIKDPVAVERLLFLDSLTLLPVIPPPEPSRSLVLLDVGSGAGVPGLPLKIARPDLRVTLLEATGKKARFLEHMTGLLELNDVRVVNARAEDAAHRPEHREAYDVVVARALAPLPVLVELCLPFARVGGIVIAPKGVDARREAEAAEKALRLLGGRVREVRRVDSPDLPPDRWLVVLEKTAPSDDVYPRRAGLPAKRPLV